MERAFGTVAVGRLAPSPTGALHLGNARTFLLAWLSIRSRGGTLPLRIEDIDGPRVKSGAAAQVIEDLRWLGLDWDGEPVLQSERLPLYAEAAARLVARGLAYPCVCTRREVEEAASAPHESGDDGPVYPGTCRGRFPDLASARAATGREPALRFRVDVDAVPFVDGFAGARPGRVAGDFVVQKRDGEPAYQLAVVVDDAAQGVTEVVRAEDLLPSTPRQLLLYRALGLVPPRFVHVPLVVGADGLRLAKRHGDTSLRFLREQGVAADAIVGFLAASCALRPVGQRCRPSDLLADFDWQRVPHAPVAGDRHGLLP
ncbi:MAG TPA: tRNA glutamyl-Q(34) synthetase GluQRS [Planctomycetota bacterium]|nr:tRNA glutamyl-Q(34) synthetase GluQRS [Planctomycetota bacterium]